MKRDGAGAPPVPDCTGRHFAIVAARFHEDVAEQLVDGARRALRDCKVADGNITIFNVPGCFELPPACRNLIEGDRFDALVALCAVVRGQTPHFDFVAGECARGIMDVQLSTGVPIGFGVLTTDTLAQARERADRNGGDKGYAAAVAAASLLHLTAGMPRAGFRRDE
ncbi:MAG: 6,7-dimethyl-8-ribityllumazine synthase [Candidatus Eremiobacteraeota bacterium]|nr:6,7-dimethyl-8-ribityllumazine synthase [Candidatus Eremiobacteraeota bacterium]